VAATFSLRTDGPVGMQPKILVIDDQEAIRLFLASALEERGYDVSQAATGAEAIAVAAAERPDLVLLDLVLPDANGMDVLARLREDQPQVCVVILTSYGEVDAAVRAMRLQAFDFVTKPVNLERLLTVIERGVASAVARPRAGDGGADLFAVLPGAVPSCDPAMNAIYAVVRKVAAQGRSTVLIEGESGVGKDILAQLIHANSPRRSHPFLEINCASLPESLLESELFGHEKGAFTDAGHQKLGLLELANSGTLFLDEIGEMSLPIQVKLLRVLEKMNFRRVGGLQDIQVDVRILAATNRNLGQLVAAGAFREDLFFRLRVVCLEPPPLRERPLDILPLAHHFLGHFNREFGKQVTGFTPAAEEALATYPWPGNIRELRNAVERAVLLGEGDLLDVAALDVAPVRAGDHDLIARLSRLLREPLAPAGVSMDDVLADCEVRLIRKALAEAGGNRTQAARLLGLGRDRLRYRLKAHGMEVGGDD
jgi:two-component system, NtrC family, response regulator AtoC